MGEGLKKQNKSKKTVASYCSRYEKIAHKPVLKSFQLVKFALRNQLQTFMYL